MGKYQTLEDKKIYSYDKVQGFQEYDPLTYEYNGYTIDNLFQLFVKQRSDIKALHNELESLKEKQTSKGINIEDDERINTGEKDWIVLEVDNDNFILKASKINSNASVYLGNDNIPEDIESGVYELINGQIRKDKNKEEEIWLQLL